MTIVALSGSLRRGSSNVGALRAFAAVAAPDVETVVFEGAGELPPFNPDRDREGDAPPPPVKAFRELLGRADAFVISCPEYAHGVPGAFKNALDWIVSSGELGGKPVVLINASAGSGAYVRRDLTDTLTVMGAEVLVDASAHLPPTTEIVDAHGTVVEPEARRALKASLAALLAAIATRAPTA